MKLQNLHLATGAIGLVVFAVQGHFMDTTLGVSNLPDGPRMMYRTAHLYLMMASVINVLMGLLPTQAGAAWRRGLVTLCSVVFLLAPFLFLLSFIVESNDPAFMRPITVYTQYGVFGAGALLVLLEVHRRLVR